VLLARRLREGLPQERWLQQWLPEALWWVVSL
jgi:hypothetical protein